MSIPNNQTSSRCLINTDLYIVQEIMNDLKITCLKQDTVDVTLSINIFLQHKLDRNKMQTCEATNTSIAACQYSIADNVN